jgi:acyl carrier protein
MSSLFERHPPDPREVIARVSGVPASRLDDGCPLSEIVPDSFALVELLLAVEEECGLRLSVPATSVSEMATIGELLAALRKA